MPGCAELGCILLAAGESRRFGGGKLEALFEGKMLGLHAAATLAGLSFGRMIAVCNPTHHHLNEALESLGFEILINVDPGQGQSRSLALGVAQLQLRPVSGVLVALADMPFISQEHLLDLVEAFDRHPTVSIICSSRDGIKMPPAIFPKDHMDKLKALSGDQGAKTLLNDAITIAGTAAMLADIDRREDFPG